MSKKKQVNPLGAWQVIKSGPKKLQITLPEGMKIEGDEPLTIQDIKEAIEVFEKHEPVSPKCCRRRLMIA